MNWFEDGFASNQNGERKTRSDAREGRRSSNQIFAFRRLLFCPNSKLAMPEGIELLGLLAFLQKSLDRVTSFCSLIANIAARSDGLFS